MVVLKMPLNPAKRDEFYYSVAKVAVIVFCIICVVALWVVYTSRPLQPITSTSAITTSTASEDYFSLTCQKLQLTVNLEMSENSIASLQEASNLLQIMQLKGCPGG